MTRSLSLRRLALDLDPLLRKPPDAANMHGGVGAYGIAITTKTYLRQVIGPKLYRIDFKGCA